MSLSSWLFGLRPTWSRLHGPCERLVVQSVEKKEFCYLRDSVFVQEVALTILGRNDWKTETIGNDKRFIISVK